MGPSLPGALAEALEDLGLTDGLTPGNIALRLGMGGVTAWLYAASRRRLGPTPFTAFRIGLAVWFVAYAPPIWALGGRGVVSGGALTMLAAWGLVETTLAAIVGGAVHRRLRRRTAYY